MARITAAAKSSFDAVHEINPVAFDMGGMRS
jgi:hypothetical protein